MRLNQPGALHLSLPSLSLLLLLSSASSSTARPAVDDAIKQGPIEGVSSGAKRVAIIGAGASGTSAAWFLDRAASEAATRQGVDKSSLLSEVFVFDQNDYVGGRVNTVYPYGNTSLRAVELGASIFVEANKDLYKAAKRFGLETVPWVEDRLGIWDGEKFLFAVKNGTDPLEALVGEYGNESIAHINAAAGVFLGRVANLYDPTWLADHGPAHSVQDLAEQSGLGDEYTGRTGAEWAGSEEVGAGERWIGEFMDAVTRQNSHVPRGAESDANNQYALDIDEINGLGAAVTSATGGSVSVQGGNRQIFEAMLDESGATKRLSTEVIDVVPLSDSDHPKFEVHTKHTNAFNDNGIFDQVFYAAPWYTNHEGGGYSTVPHSLQEHLSAAIPETEFIRLHVTLLTTTLPSAHPSFFGLSNDTEIPPAIFTTSHSTRQDLNQDQSVTVPPFQSISWRHETTPGSGEWLVKIYSKAALDDATLRALLGGEEPGWVMRKEWGMAYPALRPNPVYAPVEPVRGVHYLGAQEAWVATMETQTISAREAVARVVQKWWGLGYGNCQDGAEIEAWDWSCE